VTGPGGSQGKMRACAPPGIKRIVSGPEECNFFVHTFRTMCERDEGSVGEEDEDCIDEMADGTW
jgi:hypothetical protein